MTKAYQYFMSNCIVLIDFATQVSTGTSVTWFALFLIFALNDKPWSGI